MVGTCDELQAGTLESSRRIAKDRLNSVYKMNPSIMIMNTEFTCVVHPATDIGQVYRVLREHAIVENPPFAVAPLLTAWICEHGRRLRITIDHNSRNVTVAPLGNNAAGMVVRNIVPTFQRLAVPRARSVRFCASMRARPVARAARGTARAAVASVEHGQECRICFETIGPHELQALPCAHVYHRECIARWFEESRTCPTCRLAL